jgi:hypothetical protein
MMVESRNGQAKRTTDFRFVLDEDPNHVVLAFDTKAEQTEVYLTRGQLERLVFEADNAVGKLKCREKLSDPIPKRGSS